MRNAASKLKNNNKEVCLWFLLGFKYSDGVYNVIAYNGIK